MMNLTISEIVQACSGRFVPGGEEEDGSRQKQEGDLLNHALLKQTESDVWGVFYCYPAEAEEGWGRELPVIADTVAVSFGANFPSPFPSISPLVLI